MGYEVVEAETLESAGTRWEERTAKSVSYLDAGVFEGDSLVGSVLG